MLRAHVDAQLERIYVAYQKGDWKAHTLATGGLLKFMDQHTSMTLVEIDEPLFVRVKKHGVAPYLSPVLDHGYRLQRAPTRATTTRFRQFTRLLRSEKRPPRKQSIVLLRAISAEAAHRPYSENAAWAALPLLYSRLGERQIAAGHRTEHFVRMASLIYSCREETRTKSLLGGPKPAVGSRRPCTEFLAYVASELEARSASGAGLGTDGTIADLTARIGEGITTGPRSCLAAAANAKQAEMIKSFEDRVSCEQRKKGTPGNRSVVDPTGNIVRSVAESLPQTEEGPGEEVDRGYFSDRTVLGTTGTFGFYGYKTTKSGDTTTTTYMACDGGDGCTSGTSKTQTTTSGTGTTHYDSSDNVSRYHWNGQGENAGTEYDAKMENGKLKSETIKDEDGTTTERTYNDDGTFTEVKFDKDGNCTSNCANASTSASTPVDEFGQSCGPGKEELLASTRGAPGPLDRYIIPAPDAPTDASDSCLTSILTSGPSAPSQQCKSVALCLEGTQPDANCKCTSTSSSGAVLPPTGGVCARVMCAEGSCDPATGTCTSGTTGLAVPGIRDLFVAGGGPAPGALPTLNSLSGTMRFVRETFGGVPPSVPPGR